MKQQVEKETTERQRVGTTALAWWSNLKKDKGGKAQLKRCGDPSEVFFCLPFHELHVRLAAWSSRQKETAAVMAVVLAHVKDDTSSRDARSFAAQMAARKGERAAVHGLRFRRLIQIKDREELFKPLIRIVRLLDGTVNVGDLAYSIWQWEHPNRFVQRQWACDYYDTPLTMEKEP